MNLFRKNRIFIFHKKSQLSYDIDESEYNKIDKDFSKSWEEHYGVKSKDFSQELPQEIEVSNVNNEESTDLKKDLYEETKSIIFGDSQTANSLGRLLSSNRIPFVGYNVGRIKNEVFLNDNLRKAISVTDKIYISGGGNPQPSGSGDAASLIVQTIREQLNDDAPIVWIAPIPPAFDGSAKGFSLFGPGIELYNKTVKGREERASEIESAISGLPNVYVVNPFDFIISNGKPGYYCGGTCDGIHAPAKVAQVIAQKAKSLGV